MSRRRRACARPHQPLPSSRVPTPLRRAPVVPPVAATAACAPTPPHPSSASARDDRRPLRRAGPGRAASACRGHVSRTSLAQLRSICAAILRQSQRESCGLLADRGLAGCGGLQPVDGACKPHDPRRDLGCVFQRSQRESCGAGVPDAGALAGAGGWGESAAVVRGGGRRRRGHHRGAQQLLSSRWIWWHV
eukprot:COSAG04_NODE_1_length_58448_cov_23.476478_24_plen_191_part_00